MVSKKYSSRPQRRGKNFGIIKLKQYRYAKLNSVPIQSFRLTNLKKNIWLLAKNQFDAWQLCTQCIPKTVLKVDTRYPKWLTDFRIGFVT
jgi:hypothetical protein